MGEQRGSSLLKLYEHQRKAVERLRTGSILCGGVGTGKSMTALAYYFEKECGGRIEPSFLPMTNPKPLYIITTARKRDTKEWEKEMAPFRLGADSSVSPPIIIDSWNNIKKYRDASGFFIFDEQRVVGSGMWVKSFLAIARRNHWILLSATPGDTWMDYLPVFIANGYYKNKTEFIRNHVIYSRFSKYPKVDRYVNQGILERHRKDILVNMEYQKHTVPEKHIVWSDYDKERTRFVMKERWDIYEDCPIQDAGGLCRVLRKITNSDRSRTDRLREILDIHKRVVLFYNFDYELELLRTFASDINIPCAEWNGHKHEAIPSGPSWIYLVQYSAGCEGWNCVETDTIVFYSLSYSYKVMVQAAGRIDRLNTPYNILHYYYIQSRSPLDLAIRKALANKRDFNERGFSGS